MLLKMEHLSETEMKLRLWLTREMSLLTLSGIVILAESKVHHILRGKGGNTLFSPEITVDSDWHIY